MVIGVKIKNRKTGEFRKAGSYSHWNKIGKTWSNLKNVKLSVCPNYWNYKQSGDFIKAYQNELNSDFLIFNDNGTSETIPVAQYFIEKLTKEHEEGGYGTEKAEMALKEVKQYCKENNIKLKEIKDE